jgi:probable F420-dependent oxidoreductase
MRQAWIRSDELGVDTLFTWDHFFPIYGDPDAKHFEGLTLVAAMAEATQRAEISALVFCQAYRNPHYFGDAMRTIDHISGGRAILAMGGGWFERDFAEFGYQYGTFGTRLDDLARKLPVIRRRMEQGNPPPLRRMPVLIGGVGERKTLRITAEHADIWHAEGATDLYRQKAEVLAAHCRDIGRDPSSIEHAWCIEADEHERAEELTRAGVGHVIVKLPAGDRGYDVGPVRELAQWRDRHGHAVA